MKTKSQLVRINRRPRFLQRLTNSLKNMLGSDIPTDATANDDFHNAIDNIVRSVQETVKKAQLDSQEKEADIRLKVATAKVQEANAKKISIEADILKQEYKKGDHSQNSKGRRN